MTRCNGALLLGCLLAAPLAEAATEEFCLQGSFDLGARYQGLSPQPGETYRSRWCVVSEGDGERVHFAAQGHSNPDMEGRFSLTYLPPYTVRVLPGEPPDLEFQGALIASEAARHRRIDPRRLVAELAEHPEWIVNRAPSGWHTVRYPGALAATRVLIREGRLSTVGTVAELPLRGRVPLVWTWHWPEDDGEPAMELNLDGVTLFRAQGSRQVLNSDQAAALWLPSGGQAPRELPGDAWPARVAMRLDTLSPGVHRVLNVRTGFHHLVVETDAGLVVADAPAGWSELHQIPPADLVPGLAISGLSERLIDFLDGHFPGRPIRAVALTHGHDDHAGGARAFAAHGAEVYAPAPIAEFLNVALNRDAMPSDRLAMTGRSVVVRPVKVDTVLADADQPVHLLVLGPNPHVRVALGIWLPGAGIFFQSDLHVPDSDQGRPRADRLQMECWFARWAVGRLPAEARVLNSHGTIATPVARLRAYLESGDCPAAASS